MAGQGRGREITKRTPEGYRTAEYAKGEVAKMGENDLTEVLNLGIEAIKRSNGRPSEYPDDEEGLQRFIEKSVSYFEHVRDVDSDPEAEQKIIPDIEGLCAHLGISRMTFSNYYRQRSEEWQKVIEQFKTIILACRKQLASTYKIPQVFEMFNMANNFDYKNSSEFHLLPEPIEEKKIASVDDIRKRLGMIPEVIEDNESVDD